MIDALTAFARDEDAPGIPFCCPTCTQIQKETAAAAEAELKSNAADALWKRICPPIYQTTDVDQLPRRDLHDQVVGWQVSRQGLLLMGASGLGKSRSMYILLRRLLHEQRWVEVYNAVAFEQECSEHALSVGDWKQWIHLRSYVPILMIDDFGKGKLTERVEEGMFTIVERRSSRGLPLLMTTNHSKGSLQAIMTPHRGPALVRRLGEFCEVLNYSAPAHPDGTVGQGATASGRGNTLT